MIGFALYSVASLTAFAFVNALPSGHIDRAVPVLPSKDSFYAVPDGLDDVLPGTILLHRAPPAPIAAFGIGPVNLDSAHQILYRTTDSLGKATATVLTVLIPHNADKGKVLSYQVAEDAASLDCAPSYAFQLESATGPELGTLVTQAEILLVEAALEQGWVVIIPDFEGPKAAYLANALAGYATLDGIRAALNSASFTGIKKNPRISMWGYSGGSLATNWAAELQPAYAPELKIAGAAVGGTVPNATNTLAVVNNASLAGLIPTGMLGLAAQYPEIGVLLDEHVKPEYAEAFRAPLSQCLLANINGFADADVINMFDDPNAVFMDPSAVEVLNSNVLGKATPKIPFYWYKSVADEVSPVEDTDALVEKYCAAGVAIEYVRDAASDHGTYAIIGAPKALSWLTDLMNGRIPKSKCSKKTVLTSLLDPATIEILPKIIIDALLALLGKPVGPIFG